MYSTRAERDTELLSMNKFLLNLIEIEYPGVWKSIKNNAIANEIINKRAIIKIEEQQRLHSGKIDFFQYRKNIDHRVTVYKETIKKNLSLQNIQFRLKQLSLVNLCRLHKISGMTRNPQCLFSFNQISVSVSLTKSKQQLQRVT